MRVTDKDKNDAGFNFGKSLEYFQKVVQDSGPAATASYTLMASVLIFTLLGYYFDSNKGTSPTGTIIGLIIGLLTGFYHLAKTIWTRKH